MRNLKKVLAVVLALAMAFSLVASAAYTDVTTGTPVAEAVDLLSGLEIVGGYPDGSFGPEKDITRAEFAKMLFITITGGDNSDLYAGDSGKYSDVKGDQWFASYVNWATQLNILGGYPDGTMKPDNNITIAEATKMLIVALGFEVGDYTFPFGFIDKANQLKMFKDVSGIKADVKATRGQIAQMTYNTLFVTSAPRFAEYVGGAINNGWVYKTPIEAVFGAKKAVTDLVATSTNMPGLANITKTGKVAFKTVAASDEGVAVVGGVYNFAGNVDDIVGHSVTVWFIEDSKNSSNTMNSEKYDEIIAITDNTDLTVIATAGTTMVPASGDIDDMKLGDLYTTVDGANIPLFYAQRTDGINADVWGTTTVNGDATTGIKITKYKGWNDVAGVTPSNWVINGGTTDTAFNKLPSPYNKGAMPFTYAASEVFTFVRNDNSDVAEKTAPWDKIFVNYWRTGEVKSVNSANIVVDGIANGGAIPMNQIKGNIAGLEKGDFVNVTVTTGIIDGYVKNIYTIEKATVLENVTLNAKGNIDVTIDGKKYTFVSRDFVSATTVMPSALVIGEKYDVVLAKGDYVYKMTGAAGNKPDYMLIKDVAQNVGGFGTKAYTVTGLLADGTTKTFELDTAVNGIGATVTVNTQKIFDTSKATGWVNNAGEAIDRSDLTDANASVAAIGQLVMYKTNVDGKINAITSITNKADAAKEYKYDTTNKALYSRATGVGSYTLDKFVDATTNLFKYDNKGVGSEYDYSDDVFTVTTMDKISAFENTAVAAYTVTEKDANKVETILMTGDFSTVADEDTLLCIPTYNYSIETIDKNTMKFGVQVIYNGGSKWVWTNPVDVTKANGNAVAQYNILWKEIYNEPSRNDATPPGLSANTAVAYMDLDEATGALLKMHANNSGTGKLLTIDSAAANVTASDNTDVVTAYRGAVVGVDNNILTVGKTSAYGKGTGSGTAYDTVEAGKAVARVPFNFDTKVMFPIAKDVQVTIVDLSPNSTGAAEGTKAGTISDLNVSTDGGTSYVIDFTLGKDKNNAAAPLEVKQILAYKWAVSNFQDYTPGPAVAPAVNISAANIAGGKVEIKVGSVVGGVLPKLTAVSGTGVTIANAAGYAINVEIPAGKNTGDTLTGTYTVTDAYGKTAVGNITVTLTAANADIAKLTGFKTANASANNTIKIADLVSGKFTFDSTSVGTSLIVALKDGVAVYNAVGATTAGGSITRSGSTLVYTAPTGAAAGDTDSFTCAYFDANSTYILINIAVTFED